MDGWMEALAILAVTFFNLTLGYRIGKRAAMRQVARWRRRGLEHPDYRHLPEMKERSD
jgi:hypothetical protein